MPDSPLVHIFCRNCSYFDSRKGLVPEAFCGTVAPAGFNPKDGEVRPKKIELVCDRCNIANSIDYCPRCRNSLRGPNVLIFGRVA